MPLRQFAMPGRRALTNAQYKRRRLDPTKWEANDCSNGIFMAIRAGSHRYNKAIHGGVSSSRYRLQALDFTLQLPTAWCRSDWKQPDVDIRPSSPYPQPGQRSQSPDGLHRAAHSPHRWIYLGQCSVRWSRNDHYTTSLHRQSTGDQLLDLGSWFCES